MPKIKPKTIARPRTDTPTAMKIIGKSGVYCVELLFVTIGVVVFVGFLTGPEGTTTGLSTGLTTGVTTGVTTGGMMTTGLATGGTTTGLAIGMTNGGLTIVGLTIGGTGGVQAGKFV